MAMKMIRIIKTHILTSNSNQKHFLSRERDEIHRFGTYFGTTKKIFFSERPKKDLFNILFFFTAFPRFFNHFSEALENKNVCLFVCLNNLAVQPNSEKPGSPISPTNKKIFLSSFDYDLLNKHVKCGPW